MWEGVVLGAESFLRVRAPEPWLVGAHPARDPRRRYPPRPIMPLATALTPNPPTADAAPARPFPSREQVAPITHDAIASLCVSALEYPNAARATLCAMTAPAGEGASSWAPLLSKVGRDTRPFRTNLLAEHMRAVRAGAAAGLSVLAIMTALLVQAARAAMALLLLTE